MALTKRKMTDAEWVTLPRYQQDMTESQRVAVVRHYMTMTLARLRKMQDLTTQQIRMGWENRTQCPERFDPAIASLQTQMDLLSAAVGERYCN